MSDDNFLIVPLVVKAMVVNDRYRLSNFQRWSLTFINLKKYTSPVPPPFSVNDNFFGQDPENNGVYLHWTLPDRLRQGKQNAAAGTTSFPLIPNRWLVVRYSGPAGSRQGTAWIIESDYLASRSPADKTCITPYLDPFAAALTPTQIGRKAPLAAWKETATGELFLTAIGPGELTFNAYQPYTENVLSIHDKLEGVESPDTLSYLVAGWYSDPGSDILASWDNKVPFAAWLQQTLNWKVPEKTAACNRTLCQGFVQGIIWNKEGPVPASQRPSDPNKVTLAVGNTSIDALTALITQQAAAQGKTDIDAKLLEAFQYSLLPRLSEPNGEAQLAQAIHAAWFNSLNGGYRWIIVRKPESSETEKYPDKPIEWLNSVLEPPWLAELNQNQAAYDAAFNQLQILQWRLYILWWARGKFNSLTANKQRDITNKDPSFTDSRFAGELDPGKANSLAAQVQTQLNLVNQLAAALPGGDTQDELADSILKYAREHNLGDDYELKQTIYEPYHEANDPVVLLAGAKVDSELSTDQPLDCRTKADLVTGFKYQSGDVTAATVQSKLPVLDLGALPAVIPAIIKETFFLDPNNATMIGAVLGETSPASIAALQKALADPALKLGTPPALDLAPWQQPWQPLFLLWEVTYFPITYAPDEKDNWSFDGSRYKWGGAGATGKSLSLAGSILLTPQSSFNFQQRLKKYRDDHPYLLPEALANLESFITGTNDWDFLSQSLDGFTRQLTLRDIDMNVTPSDKTLTTLIGSNNSIVAMLGGTPIRFKGWPPSDFQQLRSGQFLFNRVTLVDRFGQSVEVVRQNIATQFHPIMSGDMLPDIPISKEQPYRFVQLNPRILQPGRLDFEFVSSTDDNKLIDLTTGLNPVCGWLLPNHLDKSIACYDPGGNPLGEIRVLATTSGDKAVQWSATPGSRYTTLAEIRSDFPHLGQLLEALQQKGPEAFDAFRMVIDSTLWLIDPLGARVDQNLSVLIGRPLALLRARLQFQLEGEPVRDPSWQYVFTPQQPDFPRYLFPIHLGEPELREDGLIGYFSGEDYYTFNTGYLPPGVTDSYIRKIGPGNFINLAFNPESRAYITMLCDPRAKIYAQTRILPTVTLELPPRFVNPALDNMAVTFHIGPLLSRTRTEIKDKGDQETSLLLPSPAIKKGTWHWLSREGNEWQDYPVGKRDGEAHFSTTPPLLRTGYLKLTDAVGEGTPSD